MFKFIKKYKNSNIFFHSNNAKLSINIDPHISHKSQYLDMSFSLNDLTEQHEISITGIDSTTLYELGVFFLQNAKKYSDVYNFDKNLNDKHSCEPLNKDEINLITNFNTMYDQITPELKSGMLQPTKDWPRK